MREFPPDERREAVERIRRNSRPLAPIPSDVPATHRADAVIRAALLDVYGTLFISAAGDIATRSEAPPDRVVAAAAAVGWLIAPAVAASLAGACRREVERRHAAGRARGVRYPEVLAFDVWAEVLRAHGCPFADAARAVRMFAIEVECRINPVWPMPGAKEALDRLHARGIRLGIVSNAQPFTPLLFDALLGCTPADLGIAPHLCAWSWREGTAKPDAALLRKVLDTLGDREGIAPHDVAMIGNDLLNDLAPAHACGCRTWWFAGDRRSARRREGEPACAGWKPDVVFTDWSTVR